MPFKIMRLNSHDDPEPIESGIYGIIQANDIAGLQALITNGMDVNHIDRYSGWTPLEIAANECRLDIVKILLAAGASVQKGASSPLQLAAKNGFTEIVDVLLTCGKYREQKKTKKFYDALMMATVKGRVDVVLKLIAVGADVNRVTWNLGTPLHYAIQHGHTAVVKLLLASGANVNIADPEDGRTPLMNAALQGSPEIANLLLAAGANINQKDHQGQTALIIAASVGNAEIAAILIRYKADIDTKDHQGNSALMYAKSNKSAAMTESLPDLAAWEKMLAAGGDTLEDKFKHLECLFDTLDDIQQAGRVGIAQMLRIASGSSQGLSASDLLEAIVEGNLTKVQALIQAGVNVNAKDSSGQTALLQATEKNHLEIITVLIAAGADVNLDENDRYTPIMRAAYAGHIDSVRLLINAGADLNRATNYGDTALSYAQQAGHLEIVKLLRESGAKQYHPIPMLQKRGIDSIDLNDRFILVQAPVEKVSQALCQVRQASIWERDVFEKQVQLTDVCFIVFRFPGHNWTLIHEENITVSYSMKNFNPETLSQQLQNKLKEEDAQAISAQLQTQAIYYACSDTAGAVEYQLFASGESQEKFTYCCESDFSPESPPSADECVIICETFRFRSQLRHITVDDLPKRQWEHPEDDDFGREHNAFMDDFKFVNDFFQSQDAYVPVWSSGSWSRSGQQVTLRVTGLDPQDIDRMDFVAVLS